MDKREEAINRAARAKSILNDPLVVEAFAHMESEYWRLFKSIPPDDLESLKQVKAMQYMHAKFLAFLNGVVTNGKLEKMQLEPKSYKPAGY